MKEKEKKKEKRREEKENMNEKEWYRKRRKRRRKSWRRRKTRKRKRRKKGRLEHVGHNSIGFSTSVCNHPRDTWGTSERNNRPDQQEPHPDQVLGLLQLEEKLVLPIKI